MHKKIAVFIDVFRNCNFESGGEEVNYYIVKAMHELGYGIDLYCSKSFVENRDLAQNVITKDNEQIFQEKKAEYFFTLGQQYANSQTFTYLHENSRYYRNHYERTFFQQLVKSIFKPKRLKMQKLQEHQEGENLKKHKKIIVPSSFVKEDIQNAFGIDSNKIYIIPPCINRDIQNFQKDNHDTFTFGMSARSFSSKGGYELLYSIAMLKLFGYKVKAKIIYPFSTTSKKIQKIINLIGMKDYIEILDYYSNMDDFYKQIDCLVMASKRDAFGLVAPEAIVRKIPVVINTRCGVKDFIKHNETGFIYDYKRPIVNLTKTLKYILDNQNKIPEITENALQILDELTFEKFKNKFAQLIEDYKTEILN